ncbi:hypothetical protein [Amycolatopsis sp.]|uniref:hypothetical protein n=1 Tax=Amycolatopsis sp. TaxID=37632 RepID=UPI002605E822|nr:hypothetical protein [Amycolatopsis sp.]
MDDQQLQHGKLGPGQRERRPCPAYFVPAGVQFEVPAPQHRRSRGRALPPDQPEHPGHQQRFFRSILMAAAALTAGSAREVSDVVKA